MCSNILYSADYNIYFLNFIIQNSLQYVIQLVSLGENAEQRVTLCAQLKEILWHRGLDSQNL